MGHAQRHYQSLMCGSGFIFIQTEHSQKLLYAAFIDNKIFNCVAVENGEKGCKGFGKRSIKRAG